MRSLLLFAVPGLTLMQPGGNLVEIIAAFLGAIVACRMLIAVGLFGAGGGTPHGSPVAEPAE
jgi:hypothetical protein